VLKKRSPKESRPAVAAHAGSRWPLYPCGRDNGPRHCGCSRVAAQGMAEGEWARPILAVPGGSAYLDGLHSRGASPPVSLPARCPSGSRAAVLVLTRLPCVVQSLLPRGRSP
jgi:hypothetical protein